MHADYHVGSSLFPTPAVRQNFVSGFVGRRRLLESAICEPASFLWPVFFSLLLPNISFRSTFGLVRARGLDPNSLTDCTDLTFWERFPNSAIRLRLSADSGCLVRFLLQSRASPGFRRRTVLRPKMPTSRIATADPISGSPMEELQRRRARIPLRLVGPLIWHSIELSFAGLMLSALSRLTLANEKPEAVARFGFRQISLAAITGFESAKA